ncbi:Uncharacterised protein [Mycobacteroides abscessus subsp. abscessus]|nr:Uncharacterised protein [Mycobacteroides abscessus subsp. abscessus]
MSARETVVQALQEAGVVCWPGVIADEILAALKAKRIELVEVPEPDGELYEVLAQEFIFLDPGSRLPITTSEGGDVHRTAKETRIYAAHLLLAAAAADGSTGGEKLGQLDG